MSDVVHCEEFFPTLIAWEYSTSSTVVVCAPLGIPSERKHVYVSGRHLLSFLPTSYYYVCIT